MKYVPGRWCPLPLTLFCLPETRLRGDMCDMCDASAFSDAAWCAAAAPAAAAADADEEFPPRGTRSAYAPYDDRRPSRRLPSIAACSSAGELNFSFSHSYGYRYFMYLKI